MESITYDNFEDSVVVVFNRPEIRNPLSIAVVDELTELLARRESSAKRFIFTGRDQIFASGANLREIAAVEPGEAAAFAERGQRLMRIVGERETIAAVNGLCFGGAFDLALACRYRVASPTAEFCHPGANLGIMTGWGGTQRLTRLVGEARALEIFMTARRVTADEAHSIGLVDAISVNPLETALKFPSA